MGTYWIPPCQILTIWRRICTLVGLAFCLVSLSLPFNLLYSIYLLLIFSSPSSSLFLASPRSFSHPRAALVSYSLHRLVELYKERGYNLM